MENERFIDKLMKAVPEYSKDLKLYKDIADELWEKVKEDPSLTRIISMVIILDGVSAGQEALSEILGYDDGRLDRTMETIDKTKL